MNLCREARELKGGDLQGHGELKLSLESFWEERMTYLDKRFDEVSFHIQDCERHLTGLFFSLQGKLQDQQGPLNFRTSDPSARRAPGAEADAGALAAAQAVVARGPSKESRFSPQETVPLLSDRDDHDYFTREEWVAHNAEDEQVTLHDKLLHAKAELEASNAHHSDCGKAVTAFLEDPESSYGANLYSIFMFVFNSLSVSVSLFEVVGVTVPPPHDELLDIFVGCVFFMEVLVRFFWCPDYYMFCINPLNVIDVLSATPLLVLLAKDSWGRDAGRSAESTMLVIVPVMRLLRLVRHFPYIKLLTSAFQSCLEALPVLLYTMAVMGCTFTSLIFLVEPRDNVGTMAEAAWLVLATMTTVGYGDVTPVTDLGYFLTSALMIVSSLYMAMPVAIVGWGFTETWGDRSHILLRQDVTERLLKWGFGPYDIPRLFDLFDFNDNSEMDCQEFHTLLTSMQIGFRDDEIMELFKLIDDNISGSITVSEFVKTLYPTEFREMCMKGQFRNVASTGKKTA